jgi:hypothetical protein
LALEACVPDEKGEERGTAYAYILLISVGCLFLTILGMSKKAVSIVLLMNIYYVVY